MRRSLVARWAGLGWARLALGLRHIRRRAIRTSSKTRTRHAGPVANSETRTLRTAHCACSDR
jgi:hypothetical protein